MARKATYDQEKVKLLRAVLIEDSLSVFNDDPKVAKWSQYRKDLLMKYAPRVLPTLNAGKNDDEDAAKTVEVQIINAKESTNTNTQ